MAKKVAKKIVKKAAPKKVAKKLVVKKPAKITSSQIKEMKLERDTDEENVRQAKAEVERLYEVHNVSARKYAAMCAAYDAQNKPDF